MNNIEKLKRLLYNDVKAYYELETEATKSRNKTEIYRKIGKIILDFDNFEQNYPQILKELKKIYNQNEIDALDLPKKVQAYLEDKNNQINKDNLQKAIQKIASDFHIEHYNYQRLRNILLGNNKKEMIESRRIISYLKYGHKVNDEQIAFIKNRLERENCDKERIEKTVEEIKVHNENCSNIGTKVNKQEIYSVFELVRNGYEKLELPDGNFENLDEKAKILVNTINELDKKDWKEQIKFLAYFDQKEKEYIIIKAMMYYQNNIYDIIDLLKDENMDYDANILKMIRDEYQVEFERYMFLRQELDLIKSNEPQEPTEEKTPNEDDDFTFNNLYYLSNSDDPERCFLISDLYDMREEAYETVNNLIQEFKKGDKTHLELYRYNPGYFKLKDDQVRILLKSLKNNNYIVIGAFIKKADRDTQAYGVLTDRYRKRRHNGQDLKIEELKGLEYSEKVEETLSTIAEEYGRKNKRQ